uniref:Apple domain-containing protein n=2 Tax=Octopus bimaculoides TaxID=37653 RepID=A0A0L8HWA4_OCTBM
MRESRSRERIIYKLDSCRDHVILSREMEPTMNMKIHFVLYFTLCFFLARGQGDESYYYRSKFIKVTNATIDGNFLLKMPANDSENCAEICHRDDMCNSFVLNHVEEWCELYRETTRAHRLLINSNTDYYELRHISKGECPVSVIYGAKFQEHAYPAKQGESFFDILKHCYQSNWCKAFSYNSKSAVYYLSNYTSHNATVIVIKNDWQHIEFIKSFKFEMKYNLDDIQSPSGCTLRNLRTVYFKNELNKNGGIQATRYTRRLDTNTFTKLLKRPDDRIHSRISCAASCDLTSECIGFTYINNKCAFKTFY